MKSVRAAYKGHCTQDFKRAEKLIASTTSDQIELEAPVDRLTRGAGEIAQMDAEIVMSLETEEDILKDTESALLLQDNISDWQFKIKQFLGSKQETPVGQFHHSSFKQAPTPRMHINLPKINIKGTVSQTAHVQVINQKWSDVFKFVICETKWRQQAEGNRHSHGGRRNNSGRKQFFLIPAAAGKRNGRSREEEFGSK